MRKYQYVETNETQYIKIYGYSKSSTKRVVCSNELLHLKKRSQINNLTLYFKKLAEQSKYKISRKKGIINIKAEIKEIENRKIEKNQKFLD